VSRRLKLFSHSLFRYFKSKKGMFLNFSKCAGLNFPHIYEQALSLLILAPNGLHIVTTTEVGKMILRRWYQLFQTFKILSKIKDFVHYV